MDFICVFVYIVHRMFLNCLIIRLCTAEGHYCIIVHSSRMFITKESNGTMLHKACMLNMICGCIYGNSRGSIGFVLIMWTSIFQQSFIFFKQETNIMWSNNLNLEVFSNHCVFSKQRNHESCSMATMVIHDGYLYICNCMRL